MFTYINLERAFYVLMRSDGVCRAGKQAGNLLFGSTSSDTSDAIRELELIF